MQVRQSGNWVDVSNQSVSPAYPYDSSANGGLSYTFTFDDTSGDGIRIYGVPVQVNGFNFAFTTIGEFEAYYKENVGSSNPNPPITFEGETLSIGTNTGPATIVQNFTLFNWSGNSQLLWPTTNAGDTLVLNFTVENAGTYELALNLTKAADYGNLSFAVNGQPVGGTGGSALLYNFIGYNNGVVTELHSLGTHTLASGSHTLTLTVLGKEANSANYFAGIDFLRIVPQ